MRPFLNLNHPPLHDTSNSNNNYSNPRSTLGRRSLIQIINGPKYSVRTKRTLKLYTSRRGQLQHPGAHFGASGKSNFLLCNGVRGPNELLDSMRVNIAAEVKS